MANQIVGLENLPNVYISKITLNNNNSETYYANIKLQVMDFSEAKGFMWNTHSIFYNFLRVGLISTDSPTLAAAIRNGTQSPHPSLISSMKGEHNYNLQKISISEFIKFRDGKECSYNKITKIEIPWDIENYAVFAFAYIDTQDLSNYLEIDLGGILKHYVGAVASEKIIERKQIISTTSIFVKPDNEIWPGPVHLHPATGYMAGSKHSSNQHSALKHLKVQNLKLSDARTILYHDKMSINRSNNTIIGPLLWSINRDINLLGVFSVNIKQFALLKTVHGKAMYELGPSIFQEFLNSIEINSMSIVRQQVRTIRVGNSLGTPKIATHKAESYKYLTTTIDQSANNLKSTDRLQQIYLNSDYRIRTYQFKDDENNAKTKGQYVYKADISIVDKSQEFLNRKIEQIQSNISQLKEIVFKLNRRTSYNHETQKLRSGKNVPAAILGIIESYCLSLSYFRIMDNTEITYEINQRMIRLTTANYTPTEGNRFVTEFEALATTFMNKFKVFNKFNITTKPKNNKKSFIPNLIMIDKQFEPIVQFSDYRRYYDYLGTSIDLSSPVSQETLQIRANLEASRFFTAGADKMPLEFKTLENETAKAIIDTSEASQAFLAPVTFNYDSTTFNLKDLPNVDNSGLTTQFFNSVVTSENQIRPYRVAQKKHPKRTRVPANPRKTRGGPKRSKMFKKRFTPSFRIPKFIISPVQREFTVDSSEFLGYNSYFSNPDGNLNYSAINQNIIQVSHLLNTTSLKTGANKFKFDLKTPNSAIGQFIRSKSFKRKKLKLKKIPVASKALMCSRAPAAKNEILSSGGDVLQNAETKVTSQMIFQTSQKIEILTGYQKDKNNNPMLTAPIWMEMDFKSLPKKGGIICRMIYVEIPELGISPAEIFKLPYLDQIFIMGNNPVTVNITELPEAFRNGNINMDSKNTLSKNIKYATTNIVTQNFYKDPLANKTTEESPQQSNPSAGTGTPMGGGGY